MGVSTLKQLALTKGPYVPTLNAVVPYLDFSSNQEYLVKRIKGIVVKCASCIYIAVSSIFNDLVVHEMSHEI